MKIPLVLKNENCELTVTVVQIVNNFITFHYKIVKGDGNVIELSQTLNAKHRNLENEVMSMVNALLGSSCPKK